MGIMVELYFAKNTINPTKIPMSNTTSTVEISSERIDATPFSGLVAVVRLIETSLFLEPFFEAVTKAVPLKPNAQFPARLMVMQRLLGSMAGFGDLNDHDTLRYEPGFQAALQASSLAGSSTLCRFENRFNRHSIDAVNSSLFECLIKAEKRLGLMPRAKPRKETCLYLDVDSTHVDLHGNQEKKSYNAHYQTNCHAPCLCYLNGWPIAIFNAAGTDDARKVLEPQLRRLLGRIQKAFPKYSLVLRADAGFNSTYIVDTCRDFHVHYIMGFSPNKAAQKAALTGIQNPIIKLIKRFTTEGFAWRKLGVLVNYQAKSWKTPRRLIARKQYDPRTNQMDLRLIQTSVRETDNPEDEGYCGDLSAMGADRLYEEVYCGRGCMEQDIGEFKRDFFGARASATKFFTNSFRMILAMVCQFFCKVLRFLLRRVLRKVEGRENERMMSVAKFRQRVLWVISQITREANKTILTLPNFLLDETAFLTFFNLQIA